MSAATTISEAIPNTSAALFELNIRAVWYGAFRAVRDVRITIRPGTINAFIGPSGCGKSTVLRSMNRMNDLIPSFRLEGRIDFMGQDIYRPGVDPVLVRRHIGMIFQQPNPFATSIRKNVAFGLKLNGVRKKERRERVEQALKQAALWDEVKDKLKQSGLSLSGGQQQRLCIARALATDPPVLLMDEPCSALDPISSARIEALMKDLSHKYTIIIATHNLQQALRVADETAFFYVDTSAGGRTGYLVESGPTRELFERPRYELTRQYVAGVFG
jgi:phosphate transport system ATP-binding protein